MRERPVILVWRGKRWEAIFSNSSVTLSGQSLWQPLLLLPFRWVNSYGPLFLRHYDDQVPFSMNIMYFTQQTTKPSIHPTIHGTELSIITGAPSSPYPLPLHPRVLTLARTSPWPSLRISSFQDPMPHCSDRPLTTDQYITIYRNIIHKELISPFTFRFLITLFTFLSLKFSHSSWSAVNDYVKVRIYWPKANSKAGDILLLLNVKIWHACLKVCLWPFRVNFYFHHRCNRGLTCKFVFQLTPQPSNHLHFKATADDLSVDTCHHGNERPISHPSINPHCCVEFVNIGPGNQRSFTKTFQSVNLKYGSLSWGGGGGEDRGSGGDVFLETEWIPDRNKSMAVCRIQVLKWRWTIFVATQNGFSMFEVCTVMW